MSKKFIIAILLLFGVVAIGAFLLVNFVILNEKTLPKIEVETSAANEKPKNNPTPSGTIPPLNLKISDVSSVTLETVYKDYFDENSKCRKTYNEVFGKEDGFYSPSSPCTIAFDVNRDGSVTKTIEMQRWNKQKNKKEAVEKNEWKANIDAKTFDVFAKNIVETETFKNWNDGVSLNVVNTTITVRHSKGSRTLMSNVDKNTTVFLKLLDNFHELDKKVSWEKVY
ncbi:MAG TPA: hypothetical protein PKY59_10590 [Pyrinomonadaceae bacterium]|nr:hypothetical protein [Pyrinomonadaceae bacterium]